ncbi:MAG TPA: XTP/dITP diphosphatase [bacterium]
MKKIVFATRNEGKVREIKFILKELPLEIISLNDITGPPEIEEEGYTYRDNALHKAAIITLHTGMPALGEDSGLEVTALNGRPGIFSARYSGWRASDRENITKLLEEMKDVLPEKRQARFCSAVALATPDGERQIEEGDVEGEILFEPRGNHGFGYDPVFYVPDYKLTMAEMPPERKNIISHRARAFEKITPAIKKMLNK